jgi:predicted lysophospholipase L1 biosynthesis ABC-type transport system permease subunit
MTFLKYFFYVVGAALLSAIIGGVFAAVVALISPEFVKGLFTPQAGASLPRYAAAVGMIWGVFIGAGVMGFCLGLVTLVQIARVFAKKKGQDESTDESAKT